MTDQEFNDRLNNEETPAATITPTPTPAPTVTQPTQPVAPAPAPTAPMAAPGQPPKTTIGADGKGRTTYGGYVRVVTQDGPDKGKVTWEDTNGNPVEAPKSQQMMDKLNQGLRPKGDLSWDDALKQQSFESIGKAQQYARNAIEANRLAIENRRKRKAKQNAKVADEMGSAFANLQGNLEDVSKHIADGGSIEDSGAYKSKDGNYYVRGIVAVDRLGEFNKEMAGLGGKDSMERIVVSQQVSKTTGKPIGEPTFAALYRKNGIDGQGDGVYAKKLNLAQAVNYARKSQVDLGRMSDQEAKEYAVWAFGGKNPLNWDVKKPDAPDFKSIIEQGKLGIEQGKLGVEQDKQRLEWAKFNASKNNGGVKSSDGVWNKDQHEAMTKMLDSLMFTTDAVTGDRSPREMSPDEQKQADFLRGQIMRGFGYTPAPDQSQQPQYTDEDRAAAIAKLRERGIDFGGVETNPPIDETKQPVGETKPPAGATKQPAGETKQPVAETQKSNLETQDPNLGTQKPNLGTEKPRRTLPKRTSDDIRKEMAGRGKVTLPTATSNPPDDDAGRRKQNGAKANFLKRYKTVQDVARDVVRTLNDGGKLSSIVNPDGTRRKELTPQEKDVIIHNVHKKFIDAGMSDFWDREVEEYTQENRGGRLTTDAIIDKLFRDWNNKEAPFKYGYKK